ncbi:MAG: flagellar biosynthetic protein FliQ [Parvularculaceae bacterium]|nr:MAG: flagellar biosynthetic protein FliQ [Parvularculaceae bacterium]
MESQILDLLREALWAGFMMAMPLLATALVVGIFVGLIQALTSIQEMTLTFVPKLGAMLVAFWMSADFMLRTLTMLFVDRIIPMIIG